MKSTFKRVLLAIAAVAVIGFGFTGCQQEAETEYVDNYFFILPIKSTDLLIGEWKNPDETYGIEKYTITTNTFASEGSYEGDELVVRKVTDDAGYIYVKYTRSMNADYSYSETAPDVGKWYAIAYKGLTTNSIQISGAYGAKSSTDTLIEAVQEFTIENGYFGFFSNCAKN